ncbi:MAG: 4-(cytidine 5'-diphospho)-2-C-methyl-D-erythritol kinase, partial [Proteobacteria bacterium]|nr:4-(cytidine 5'-diphospho)-2-C-methyl-D-erythritol kinase [Pseudomonadota bacterium]
SSLVAFTELGDQLALRPILRAHHPGDQLTMNGRFSGQISNEKMNLVLQALAVFRSRWPGNLPEDMEIKLTKNLPVASGIGGGSADAAAMLRLLNRLCGTAVDHHDILEMAAELGADVPMCVESTPRITAGIGEVLGPVLVLPKMYVVLINPLFPVATADVFSSLLAPNSQPLPEIKETFSDIKTLIRWLKSTRNDLEPVANRLVPEILEISDFMTQASDCLLARMSGSGETIFALFEHEEQAECAAIIARQQWPDYWVARTHLR